MFTRLLQSQASHTYDILLARCVRDRLLLDDQGIVSRWMSELRFWPLMRILDCIMMETHRLKC